MAALFEDDLEHMHCICVKVALQSVAQGKATYVKFLFFYGEYCREISEDFQINFIFIIICLYFYHSCLIEIDSIENLSIKGKS